MLRTTTLLLLFTPLGSLQAQDTFSIAAVDTLTGEVGSAGASCVNLFQAGITDPGFLAQQLPGVGSINTQSFYLAANQTNAMARMQAGDNPDAIMAWLAANDVQGNPAQRQYGAAKLLGSGSAAAGYTGVNCLSYAEHITGPNYAIQGNILLGPEILQAMEANFLNTEGTLADKLMAALQGANVVGADTRCAANGTSSLFAFIEVAQTNDPFDQPSLALGVRLGSTGVEPIDSLQSMYNAWVLAAGVPERVSAPALQLQPNPVLDRLFVGLPTKAALRGVQLLDATGRTVPVQVRSIGDGRMELSVDHLRHGYYTVIVEHGDQRSYGRFVKQ
ncbi:MAG: DUF1028 domain-containing protein [Flavobacteriales bacterium]